MRAARGISDIVDADATANRESVVVVAHDPLGPDAVDHPRLARNLRRQCRLVLFFAVPLGGLYITAGPAILSLFGPQFAAGHRALAWLASAGVGTLPLLPTPSMSR